MKVFIGNTEIDCAPLELSGRAFLVRRVESLAGILAVGLFPFVLLNTVSGATKRLPNKKPPLIP